MILYFCNCDIVVVANYNSKQKIKTVLILKLALAGDEVSVSSVLHFKNKDWFHITLINSMSKNVVVTKGGKNKDQYGRKFGKKHNEAMLEFTKNLWLQDAVASLKYLLQVVDAQNSFMSFLKTEYGEAQLEFYIEAQKLEAMDPASQAQNAIQIYNMFMNAGGKGIGQQERTTATQQMWDRLNSGGSERVDSSMAIQKIREEAETTLKMLAFDAFPRFIKSPYCKQAVEALKSSGNGGSIENMIASVDSKGPQDADDWLNTFVATAESFPACIVISDMTIPGAPMVFVNQEFCRTTGYSREEAVGRNCRFLQGPETEPEAIQVIRNTLSKGQDCHVKLTNYRKNGELFQNLLSMRPVFDADNIYRYVIGVQFEIKEDQNLKQRLVQLDKLLRLLPSKLPFKSKAAARAKGALAVKTSGEANQMVGNKEQILAQAKQQEIIEMSENKNQPKSLVGVSSYDPRTLNYDRTVSAFTKIMWLQDPVSACRSVLIDPLGKEAMTSFAEGNCGILVQFHLKFFESATQIRLAQGSQQMKKMRSAHMKKQKNAIYYCTTTEIDYGNLNTMNWGPVFENMCKWQEQTTMMLAQDTFQRFLEHPSSNEYIGKIRQRELAGENLPIKTAAYGVNPQSESFWLDMFKNMSETVTVGMVISDMTIPGIPLAYINEGFNAVTGYGKEKIGTNCRFLQVYMILI
jgi:PAS domain S-box-containing protein